MPLFKKGLLHNERFALTKEIQDIALTGDILVRMGRSSVLGFQFDKAVAKLTNSKYSHASVVVMRDNYPYVVEVNDRGTLELRVIDWLDTAGAKNVALYRVPDISFGQRMCIKQSCNLFLDKDPDYDFTFSDDELFYCTESVVSIFNFCNMGHLFKANKPEEFLKKRWHRWINRLIMKTTGKGIPFGNDVYVVGNSLRGMMINLDKIWEYNG